MIREKLFRRDEPVIWEVNDKKDFKIDVEYSSRYEKQMMNLSMSINKDIVKKLIKGIKLGYIYSDGKYGGDTHYLKDFSKTEIYLTYSKSINTFDRLNYRIYKPILLRDDAYHIRIVIDNISGHNISGKSYSGDDEIYNPLLHEINW